MVSRLTTAVASLAFASMLTFPGAAGAQTSSADAPDSVGDMHSKTDVACDRADRALMSGMPEKSMLPVSSGNLDKDFAAMMDFHDSMMLNMAKLEMRCGTNQDVKEAARRFVQNAPRTHRFSGTSQ